MKKATIKDVAKASGYSTATVSLALAEGKTRIPEETRRKIREVARRMDYQPNKVAVNLATHRSHLISVVVANLTNPHVSTFYMAVESTLRRYGYSSICHTSEDAWDYSLDMLQQVVADGAAGLILTWPYEGSLNDEKTRRMRRYLEETSLPLVTRNMPELNARGVEITFNFVKGGYLATKHLLELGHRRIGCVAGPLRMPVTQQRLEGYRAALEEAGLPYRPELIFEGDYTMAGAAEALSYHMGQKVSAVFAFNDEMAFSLYRSARLYGISIPRDISVMGFDNVPFDDVLEVPLSTVHMPTREMGCRVAEEMVDMIENGRPAQCKTVVYEPSLMIRGSTIEREETLE